jgi:hypothetical protein
MQNKTLWTELWRRAQQEKYGLRIRFSDGDNGRLQLHYNRPPNTSDYTICRTSDPQVIIITPPGTDLKAEEDAQALAMIRVDELD